MVLSDADFLGKAAKEFSEKPFLGASLGSMGGKYNDLVYTGMSIYQYIPVYTSIYSGVLSARLALKVPVNNGYVR